MIAIPIFAFFAASVAVGRIFRLADSPAHSITVGIIIGLVFGKSIGISLSTFLVTRIRGVSLDHSIRWVDLIGSPRCRRRRVASVSFPHGLPWTEVFSWEVAPGDACPVSVNDAFDDSTVVLERASSLAPVGGQEWSDTCPLLVGEYFMSLVCSHLAVLPSVSVVKSPINETRHSGRQPRPGRWIARPGGFFLVCTGRTIEAVPEVSAELARRGAREGHPHSWGARRLR